MTLKIIRHLFYATLNFVHHFMAVSEFGLELQSGNSTFGSNSAIFCPVWPCNFTDDLEKTIGHLFYATSRFVHRFIAIIQFKLELWSGNAKFGYISAIFCPAWPWKTVGHLIQHISSFLNHFIAIGQFKLEWQPGNAKFGSISATVRPVWLSFNGWPWKQ